jgi:serine/threonine protein kinase
LISATLSHFRLTDKLGAGCMGEVYRSEDTRLRRSVAIKVLPEAFVADPERNAPFVDFDRSNRKTPAAPTLLLLFGFGVSNPTPGRSKARPGNDPPNAQVLVRARHSGTLLAF